jgi:hypothetical protein
MSIQVNNLEQLLAWVKSSPCQFTVSSMSNECVHVKFNVPSSRSLRIDQRMRGVCYNTLDILGDDDKYRKGHADGVQEVIGYVKSELDHFGG